MNDPVLDRVAREDPARLEPLTVGNRHDQEAMRVRLLAAIDREPSPVWRRFHGSGRSLLAGVASVVAVVAVVVAFATVGHHSGTSKPTRPAGGDRSLEIPAQPVELYDAGVVDVGGPAQALLVDGDSVWVATPRSVVGLDLRDGSTIGRVSIPTDGVNAGLASGAGSIWLAATGQSQLLRIDPANGQLVAKIRLDASRNGRVRPLGGGVAFAAGTVWATRDSSGPRGDVVAVNPATNRIVGAPVTVGTGPDVIVSGFGSLWVDNTSVVPPDTAPTRTYPAVSRIDPRTRRVTTEPFSGTPAAGFGSLWIPAGAGSDSTAIVRYDPATRRVIARIAVPRVVGVAFGDGRVWAISYPRSRSARTFTPIKGTAALWQIDPRTNRAIGKPIHLQLTQPDSIAVSRGQLWIADYNSDKVIHFQLTKHP
jgi:sugar lactone lactonase YvrE